MARAKRLLDSLNPLADGQLRLDLARVLPGALSPAARALLLAITREAQARRMPLYLVGGFVRDLLLGTPTLDLDLVVEGDAIALGSALVRKLGGQLQPHRAFRTAVWTLPAGRRLPAAIDLISARRETYSNPGALPDVQLAAIYDDQYRRDFSINTLALRLDGVNAGQILDSWHGLADLRNGVLRVLHPGSFADDPTRILRLLRFAGRLGFRIEPGTLAQMKANVPLLELISGERIANELELTLLEKEPGKVLQLLRRYGVLRAIQPGLQFNAAVQAALKRAGPPAAAWQLEAKPAELAFVLWFIQLTPAAASAAVARLRFPTALAEAAAAAPRLKAAAAQLAGLPPSVLTARLEREPLLAVYALYLHTRGSKLGDKLLRYAKTWRTTKPYFSGHDLLELGLKPGPVMGQVLDALRAAQLDGKVKTKAQARRLLERLLDERA